MGPRRPTPDSEVLASSDDDVDRHHQDPSRSAQSSARPPRRPSWLAEGQLLPARKSSFAGAGPVSPMSSQGESPSVEPPAWATSPGQSSTVARPPAVTAASFPWSSSIWNSDTRKELPARLAEVLPSPTSAERSSGWGVAHDDNDSVSSDANIPFAIPLHPTPKSYRSQSYSVGQLDPDTNGLLPHRSLLGQARAAGQPSGLRNRPSRPSMLSELSRDSTSLDQVQEAEDDGVADEEDDLVPNGTRWGSRHASDAAAVEHLSREKALLRQAAMANQLENARLRGQAINSPTTSVASMSSLTAPSMTQRRPSHGHRIQESVPEESDYAVDEVDDLDELHAFTSRNLGGRRFSEFGVDADGRFGSLEHRKIENLKKGYWQSSLGFGAPADGPQSRRHSFADVPARSGSVSSSAEHPLGTTGAHIDPSQVRPARADKPSRLAEAVARPIHLDQGELPFVVFSPGTEVHAWTVVAKLSLP